MQKSNQSKKPLWKRLRNYFAITSLAIYFLIIFNPLCTEGDQWIIEGPFPCKLIPLMIFLVWIVLPGFILFTSSMGIVIGTLLEKKSFSELTPIAKGMVDISVLILGVLIFALFKYIIFN